MYHTKHIKTSMAWVYPGTGQCTQWTGFAELWYTHVINSRGRKIYDDLPNMCTARYTWSVLETNHSASWYKHFQPFSILTTQEASVNDRIFVPSICTLNPKSNDDFSQLSSHSQMWAKSNGNFSEGICQYIDIVYTNNDISIHIYISCVWSKNL